MEADQHRQLAVACALLQRKATRPGFLVIPYTGSYCAISTSPKLFFFPLLLTHFSRYYSLTPAHNLSFTSLPPAHRLIQLPEPRRANSQTWQPMCAQITSLNRTTAVNGAVFKVLQLHHLDRRARAVSDVFWASGQMHPALRGTRRKHLQTLRWQCCKGEPEGLIHCHPCLGQVVVFH